MTIFNAHASLVDDSISPLTNVDARNVFFIGSSVTLITSLFKSSFVKSTQRELQESKPLCCTVTKAGNNFLQIVPNVMYSFGFGLHYWITGSDDSKRRSLNMAEATLFSGLVTDILKPIFKETRPNGGTHSFPSGHTTTAFAFASYVAMEHEWYYGAPAYLMATFVGFCRMHDNYHYLNDIMAGATIGMSYGIALGLKEKNKSNDSAFLFLPSEDLKGGSFAWKKFF